MLAHVFHPVTRLEEAFAAQHAFKPPLLSMNTPYVSGEFVPAGEVGVTLVAFVRLHSTVDTHDMQGQAPLHVESCNTQRALELPVPLMPVNVSPQRVLVIEACLTLWTLKWFFPSVAPRVGNVTIPLLECLATLFTDIVSFLRSLATEKTLVTI